MTEFTPLEAAIHAWVLGASGLAQGQVFFSHQPYRPDSSAMRIAIMLGDSNTEGEPWENKTVDMAQAGQEVAIESQTICSMPVTLQAFAPAVVGSTSARQMLSKVRASLGLSTYRRPLNAAGLGVCEKGPVRWVPAIAGSDFEGRAVLEVGFTLSEQLTERFGYIAKVKVRMTVNEKVMPVIQLGPTPDSVGATLVSGGDPDLVRSISANATPDIFLGYRVEDAAVAGIVLVPRTVTLEIIAPNGAIWEQQVFANFVGRGWVAWHQMAVAGTQIEGLALFGEWRIRARILGVVVAEGGFTITA